MRIDLFKQLKQAELGVIDYLLEKSIFLNEKK